MNFWSELIGISQSLGFVDFGIAASCALPQEETRLFSYLQEGHQGRMHYLARNPEQRCNPALLVENAASIWIFLAPYAPASKGSACGRIAGYAQGVDYHLLIKQRLHQLLKFIQQHFPKVQGRAFTDSAPLLERAWAVRCGLGFIGRNGLLIHPEYGSRVLIGALVLNLPTETIQAHIQSGTEAESGSKRKRIFNKDEIPVLRDRNGRPLGCGHCYRCIEHCPGHAFPKPYHLNACKCIAYRTLEEPAMIRSEAKRLGQPIPERAGEARPLAGWLYGCDTCQEVCPWNKKAKQAGWPEFCCYQEQLDRMQHEDWQTLDQASFQANFPNSPLLRCGLPLLADDGKDV